FMVVGNELQPALLQQPIDRIRICYLQQQVGSFSPPPQIARSLGAQAKLACGSDQREAAIVAPGRGRLGFQAKRLQQLYNGLELRRRAHGPADVDSFYHAVVSCEYSVVSDSERGSVRCAGKWDDARFPD